PLGRVRIAVQQRAGGEHHARRAEAALQAVLLHEALLDGIEHPVALEALNGRDLVARSACRQHRARLHRLAVHQHDARAAVGRVAAPVRAGQVEVVADEVDEQRARLDVGAALLAVDGQGDLHQFSSRSARAVAVRSARSVSPRARWRLYSSDPRWSEVGEQSSAARSAAAANAASPGACPASDSWARSEVTAAPTAVSAIPACAIDPPSIRTAAATAATAQSPTRRSTF